jgi:general L-amino acid transport system substrate-binding protein
MKQLASLTAIAAFAISGMVGGAVAPALAADGPTLAAVKKRGELICGVHQGRYGFAIADKKGKWTGLDVDVCKAVAAAVLGDGNKVKYIPLGSVQRFPALQSGQVDMLSRTTTITLTRDSALGLNFGPPTFYTGTGFMVRKKLNITKVDQLGGAAICVFPGSTTEKNIAALFKSKGMKMTPVVIENSKELVSAYMSGRCDVLAMDQAGLPGHQQFDAKNPADHIILDGVYSKEPLGVGVRADDDQWFDITKWVVHALFNAEEWGISQKNVDKMKESKDPNVKRLLGASGNLGKKIGLGKSWAYDAIKSVGNYGEIYDRNWGPPLNLARGINQLWTKGGLMYGFPMK